MFFVLSKTLGLLALPTNFMIVLGLLGVVLMLTRFAVFGRRLVVAAMLLLAVLGLTPLGSLMLSPLESRFPKWDPAKGAPDGIIVLGGPVDPDLSIMYG
ncbi:MAG: YdcF family protein, partial [Bradyrhizobium sp.]